MDMILEGIERKVDSVKIWELHFEGSLCKWIEPRLEDHKFQVCTHKK